MSIKLWNLSEQEMIEDFFEFAKSKNPDEYYNYTSNTECAIAQWAKARTGTRVSVGGWGNVRVKGWFYEKNFQTPKQVYLAAAMCYRWGEIANEMLKHIKTSVVDEDLEVA